MSDKAGPSNDAEEQSRNTHQHTVPIPLSRRTLTPCSLSPSGPNPNAISRGRNQSGSRAGGNALKDRKSPLAR